MRRAILFLSLVWPFAIDSSHWFNSWISCFYLRQAPPTLRDLPEVGAPQVSSRPPGPRGPEPWHLVGLLPPPLALRWRGREEAKTLGRVTLRALFSVPYVPSGESQKPRELLCWATPGVSLLYTLGPPPRGGGLMYINYPRPTLGKE